MSGFARASTGREPAPRVGTGTLRIFSDAELFGGRLAVTVIRYPKVHPCQPAVISW